MTHHTAIILSGGMSSRFEQSLGKKVDKALETIDGKTMLERVADVAWQAADEVVVTVDTPKRAARYKRCLRSSNTKINIAVDEPLRCSGPLRGMATGLIYAKGDYVATLPCDIPYMKPEVILILFDYAHKHDVSVPIWPDGRLEALIGTFEKRLGFKILTLLCRMGRTRPDDMYRAPPSVAFLQIPSTFAHIDPDFTSFVNINYPWQLERLPRTTLPDASIQKTLVVNWPLLVEDLEDIACALRLTDIDELETISNSMLEKGAHFWAATIKSHLGNHYLSTLDDKYAGKRLIKEATNLFVKEARLYLEKDIVFLASHAYRDAELLLRRIGRDVEASMYGAFVMKLYDLMGLETQF